MYRKVMVEGEAVNMQAKGLPRVAKAYFLRVTSQIHHEANRRHLGETSLIATLLDHLAGRRYDQAADILAQRYTALEAMMAGLPWEKAKYLELTSEEDHSLVGQHERALMAHETAQAVKLGEFQNQSYQQSWFPKQNGNSCGKSCKGKGNYKGNPFADQAADGAKGGEAVHRAAPSAGENTKDSENKGFKGKGKGHGNKKKDHWY